MSDVNVQFAAILESTAYPAELRAKALELLAQAGTQEERRRTEELARAETVRLERTKIWLNTPIIAAVTGLLTLGATHVFALIQSKETASLANTYTRSLEERKFQFEMIKAAMSDSKDAKQRAVNLLFLVDSKILDGLNTEALRKYAQDEDAATPAFDSGSNASSRPGVEREFRKTIPPELIEDLTNRARGSDSFSWMQHAIAELGVTEIAGPDNNTRIMEYARFVDLNWPGFTDEVPWSGLFVYYVLKKAGFSGFPSSPLLNRTWSEWGVALDQPKFGAMAVLTPTPGSGASGHVGFVIEVQEGFITLLGGDQQKSVSISRFPKSRIFTLRAPPTQPLSVPDTAR
jgi:uncharacterized protein (TIGR02594 family)